MKFLYIFQYCCCCPYSCQKKGNGPFGPTQGQLGSPRESMPTRSHMSRHPMILPDMATVLPCRWLPLLAYTQHLLSEPRCPDSDPSLSQSWLFPDRLWPMGPRPASGSFRPCPLPCFPDWDTMVRAEVSGAGLSLAKHASSLQGTSEPHKLQVWLPRGYL